MAPVVDLRAAEESTPGFLVVAPDRGFLGNEETHDAFEVFSKGRNAALVFVTDERTHTSLEAALRSITGAGAQEVVVLPFFLSRSEQRFERCHGSRSVGRAATMKSPRYRFVT